jgi:hypothetical protein
MSPNEPGSEVMSDIEQRLKALEKRARTDDERWRMLDAQTQATAIIRQSIARPICAAMPKLLPVIVRNLREFEDDSRRLNAHSKMIAEIRVARQFFERLAKKIAPDRP